MNKINFCDLYSIISKKNCFFDLTTEIKIDKNLVVGLSQITASEETKKDSKNNKKEDSTFKFKLPDNKNKFLLVIKDESELINLYNLYLNNMFKNKTCNSFSANLTTEEKYTATKNMQLALDGISTHLIKYPEASFSSGQVFVRLKEDNGFDKLLDSYDFSGKEKLYSKSATIISASRPYSVDFEYKGKEIISFLDVFSKITEYPIFENYIRIYFEDYLEVLIDKCRSISDNFISMEYANTFITLPFEDEYLNIIPICSAKVLKKIQEYSFFNENDYTLARKEISVGGANSLNASDYTMYVGGKQNVLTAKVPTLESGLKQRISKALYSVSKNTSYNIIGNLKYTLKNVIDYENKENYDFMKSFFYNFNKKSLDQVVQKDLIFRIVNVAFEKIKFLIENLEYSFDFFDYENLKRNDCFISFIVNFDLIPTYKEISKVDVSNELSEKNKIILYNQCLEYQKLSFMEKENINTDLINDIYVVLEKELSNILFKNEESNFSESFSVELKKIIKKVMGEL